MIDDTRNLSMLEFGDELPYGLALDADVLPVIVPAVLPLVPVGFVLVGFVLVGFVLVGFVLVGFALGSLDGLDPFSIVPFTSTR